MFLEKKFKTEITPMRRFSMKPDNYQGKPSYPFLTCSPQPSISS